MKDLIPKLDSKNLIKLGMIAIIVIICIVGFSLIYYNFFYRKSFEEIENIMTYAAKEYYAEHRKELPKVEGESVEVKSNTLVSGDYMKSISEYVKDEDIACKASVRVTNTNNKYRFNPLLDCGRYYKYEFINDYIKNNEKIVTEGEGLYQIGENFVYRGEKLNNYVKFANTNWQIIRIENNKLILIYNEKINSTIWDDRYNESKKSNVGINTYNVSRIKDYLDNIYKSSSLFKIEDKLLMSNYTLLAGKVGENDDDHNGELVKTTPITNQYIGLINVSDYMNASIDTNCKTISNNSCSNYNYLANYEYNYWTITADKDTTNKVFKYYADEGISLATASSSGYIRPVIAITNDAKYVSGDGTRKKPYVFK